MNTSPLVKICGVRTPSDIDVCLEEQVAFVGLNLHPPSPRFVGWQGAQELRARLTPTTRAVAVMVRPGEDEVRRAVDEVGIAIVQIHGADLTYLHSLRPPAVPIWLAHGVAEEADLCTLRTLVRSVRAAEMCLDAVLVDGKVEGVSGGSGTTAPWAVLSQATFDVPLVLAGGLTPANVGRALHEVHPYAVDVASGVESAPGVKDPAAIRAFVRAVRTSQLR